MGGHLRDATRAFYRGEITLDMLRAAAHAERMDRQLADGILRLISEFERNPWAATDRVRNELRDRAKAMIPPDPPPSSGRREPGESLYAAGLRGQRRRPSVS